MATLRMHEFELIHKTGSKKIHKLDTRLSPKYKRMAEKNKWGLCDSPFMAYGLYFRYLSYVKGTNN